MGSDRERARGRWFARADEITIIRGDGVGAAAAPGRRIWVTVKKGNEFYGVELRTEAVREFAEVLIAEADAMDRTASN